VRSSTDLSGVCWDNNIAESFFSMLKSEQAYRTVYATKAQARKEIIRYVEEFYNS
jgi:transposase InsO family protein